MKREVKNFIDNKCVTSFKMCLMKSYGLLSYGRKNIEKILAIMTKEEKSF